MSKALEKFKDALPDTMKFNKWVDEWLANGGNATAAARKIYNCKDDSSAAVVGSTNLRKVKNAGAIYLESKGVGYSKMLDVAVTNMLKAGAKTPDWWDRVMRQAGWEVAAPKQEQPDNLKKRIVAEEFFDA
jgi:hypothetical protein